MYLIIYCTIFEKVLLLFQCHTISRIEETLVRFHCCDLGELCHQDALLHDAKRTNQSCFYTWMKQLDLRALGKIPTSDARRPTWSGPLSLYDDSGVLKWLQVRHCGRKDSFKASRSISRTSRVDCLNLHLEIGYSYVQKGGIHQYILSAEPLNHIANLPIYKPTCVSFLGMRSGLLGLGM